MARRMSVHEARANFSDVLGSVYHTGEPVIVERRGKPVAVLVSPEQYQQLVPDGAPADPAPAARYVPKPVSAEELERRREAVLRILSEQEHAPLEASLHVDGAELARRQELFARIQANRAKRDVRPLTSVDLIHIARDEEEESWGLGN
jgi:prevent-host-death family protein